MVAQATMPPGQPIIYAPPQVLFIPYKPPQLEAMPYCCHLAMPETQRSRSL